MNALQTLVLEGFGHRLALHGGRLLVSHDGEKREVPLDGLRAIVVPRRGVSLSSDVLRAAVERGVDLHFLGPDDRPYAHLVHPCLNATVATRRAQYGALDDAAGLRAARTLIDAKLRHQRTLLRYHARSLARRDAEAAAAVNAHADGVDTSRRALRDVEGVCLRATRDALRAAEASAGRAFWSAFARLVAPDWTFPGRRHRGDEPEALNGALNYGYAILEARVTGAALRAGLDPHAGLLHADRPGRPGMVLDLMEPWRAPVVERPVLALALRRSWDTDDEGRLDYPTRQAVAQAVLASLDGDTRVGDERWRLEALVQRDARALATALRGDGAWRPFRWRP